MLSNFLFVCLKRTILLFTFFFTSSLFAQNTYTHSDTLRGSLRLERTAFNVYYYNLDVYVDIPNKFIAGRVGIFFEVVQENVNKIQIDLFENMKITSIKDNVNGSDLKYTRDGNAIFIEPFAPFVKNQKSKIYITYQGNPIEAKQPPWDGGFIWKKDKNGNPWVAVACEGIGASLWWPNKDELSDEADSVQISISYPTDLNLVAVSNGNHRSTFDLDGITHSTWFVSYPINNYNVTLNIGKYVNFSEKYTGVEATFDLDYYVMDYNLEKAKAQFKQVVPMMNCYEKMLGPYPFPKDGYALVETPYLGMEHQGAIAYGNKYKKGYDGTERSGLPMGFDFIIIHESGHEYWGNSVGAKDIADMWIHEGFCTYSEALYVECLYGADTALLYCNAWKMIVENDIPIIGDYGVNKHGSGDMYNKGALMLHTLRWLVNDDKKWFATIKNIQKDFRFKTVSGDELIAYMNNQLGADYTWFFNQYLKKVSPPVLNYQLEQKGKDLNVTIKWDKVDDDFKLPIKIKMCPKKYKSFTITSRPQLITIKKMKLIDFKVDETHAYFLKKYY